ncbi:hypothetical protein HYH03_007982 [Edaphochlamys debaryana]|uniref:Uncharacterized protein n=1 Tax=Edaphochlamys debaryana TaxID=47281 RepID=A0A835Y7C4_9CHLO|nr:hypothetical protein HYH03_007982 [Edaphochlamys debaryana]|eukprot:KAG2493760.1 hypothetical protein HYH03_007982 [Edaphochlamys debaryana]
MNNRDTASEAAFVTSAGRPHGGGKGLSPSPICARPWLAATSRSRAFSHIHHQAAMCGAAEIHGKLVKEGLTVHGAAVAIGMLGSAALCCCTAAAFRGN